MTEQIQGRLKILSTGILVVMLILATFLPYKDAAAIADPDSVPAINGVYIYTDCLEDGDIGIFVDYTLDYAVLPTETTSDSYLVVFIDTDGATHLRAVAPYPDLASGKRGYGRGAAWIYFSASEVTTYSIDIADEALYSVWLVGNPSVPSGWSGAPPKGTSSISTWQTGGEASVLLATRILYDHADQVADEWSIALTQTTPLGKRLNDAGASYYSGVIANLRLIAPACLANTQLDPDDKNTDLKTSFGATLTNGTGSATGAPITLASGANTVTVPTVSLRFDGLDDYVTLGDHAVLEPANDFTIQLWLEWDAVQNAAQFAAPFGHSHSGTTGIILQPDITIVPPAAASYYVHMGTGATLMSANFGTYMTDGNWYLLTITKSSTAGLRLYKNGVLAATNAVATANVTYGAGDWYVGKSNIASRIMTGEIADFRIYTRVLDTAEMLADYNLGHLGDKAPTNSADLVGRWKFKEGTGVVANDTGTGGNNGTISGATWTNTGGLGTLLVTLNQGTAGTVTIGTGNSAAVTGTPLTLKAGENTLTVTETGTFTVTVALSNTQTKATSSKTGTAFDLSDAAAAFGMDEEFFSGLIWLLISILICGATFKAAKDRQDGGFPAGKITLLIFDLCIIGGGVLGMIPVLVAALLFIAFGIFTGFALFFKPASV